MGADAPVRIPFCTGTGIIPYLVIFKIQLNLISMGLVFYQALYTSLSFPKAAGFHFSIFIDMKSILPLQALVYIRSGASIPRRPIQVSSTRLVRVIRPM